MNTWTPQQLAAIDADSEIRVAAHRRDGTLRSPRIVWHVVVGDSLYIRSVRGTSGAWYRGVQHTGTGRIEADGRRTEVAFTHDRSHDDDIDRAYHDKYGHGGPVQAITSPEARATTLRVDPA
ncbi:DUF2255 family protein [Intrasporangium sp.]|uniref:DUF2255 family protein n=1 Tax=Intrasporangium sp. TaxID=1925024 RepID=UPI0032213AC4